MLSRGAGLRCCLCSACFALWVDGSSGGLRLAGSGVTLHNWSAMNKMFLYSTTGNLGIGTRFSASDLPKEKLDVDGNVNFRGQLIMDNTGTGGDNEVVFPDTEALSLTFQVRGPLLMCSFRPPLTTTHTCFPACSPV